MTLFKVFCVQMVLRLSSSWEELKSLHQGENEYDRLLTGSGKNTINGQEKFLSLTKKRPYLKPTQVGGVNILRRSSEISLRNSAKCLRILGRRRALQKAAEKWSNRLFNKNTGLCITCKWKYTDWHLPGAVRLRKEIIWIYPKKFSTEAPVNGGRNYDDPKVA